MDVDLDCPEAIALAKALLPATQAQFGRKSKPASHYLYRCDFADVIDKAALQFKEPPSKGMLVELRVGGGGSGAQTVFPGSTHESGEAIEWVPGKNREPVHVDARRLKSAVARLAAGSLLVRHWPNDGRHDLALTLGGFLARAGWTPEDVGAFFEAVARGCQV